MEELEWTIQQNKRSIEEQLKKIAKDVEALQSMIQGDDWHGYNSMTWVDGHVAEDVTRMSTLVAQQRTLVDALRMVKKQEVK